MSDKWYTRPVLFIADFNRSFEFYVNQLGFTEAWRYEEAGKSWILQVDRKGCEIILSSQWPEKAGKGLLFISLDADVLNALCAPSWKAAALRSKTANGAIGSWW